MSGISRIQKIREENRRPAFNQDRANNREIWFKDGDQAS